MADRSLSRKYVEDAMSHTVEGARRLYEFAGESVLEICWAIGKKYRPVPLAVNTEVPPEQGGEPSSTRAIVTLDPAKLGSPPVFDVRAEWKHEMGDNLAQAQQFAGFVEQKLMLKSEFRKAAMGDSNPQVFAAKLVVQEYYESDAGKADILAYAAEKMGSRKMQERFKLQEQQLLNAEGVPPGMNAGVQPPGMMAPPPTGPVAGTGMPDLAASQLGGIVGGQIAGGMRLTDAAGAGGMSGMSVGPGY